MEGTELSRTGDGAAPVRRPNELRALSALVFEDLRSFPGAIRDMHLGIAERAFRGVGPMGRPVQMIHDGLSRRGYAAVGSGAAPRVSVIISATASSPRGPRVIRVAPSLSSCLTASALTS